MRAHPLKKFQLKILQNAEEKPQLHEKLMNNVRDGKIILPIYHACTYDLMSIYHSHPNSISPLVY